MSNSIDSQNYMWSPVYRGKGEFSYDPIPVPSIGDKEVLLQMQACGLCGTDIHKIKNDIPKPGTVLGHEITGIICECGSEVEGFRIGDRVFVAHHVPCFVCSHCQSGHYSLCEQFKKSNVYPGGFAPYIRIPELNVKYTMKLIPPEISFVEASLTEPLACCIHSVDKLNIHAGDTALIIGAGSVGSLFVQILKKRYVVKTIVTDINDSRLVNVKRMGAELTINSARENVVSVVSDVTVGQGVNAVIITVPFAHLFEQAMNAVGDGGVILSFAPLDEGSIFNLDLSRICRNELTIVGAYSSTPYNYDESLELLRCKIVDPALLISHRFPLSEFSKAVAMFRSGNEGVFKIIIESGESFE